MLADLIDIITQLDVDSFLHMFWFLVLFDLPRYLFSLVAIVVAFVVDRKKTFKPFHAPVSFLLVGHNESWGLKRSVLSLREQVGISQLQIVVVDDGSSDNTADVARQLRREGLIDEFVSSGIRGGKA